MDNLNFININVFKALESITGFTVFFIGYVNFKMYQRVIFIASQSVMRQMNLRSCKA